MIYIAVHTIEIAAELLLQYSPCSLDPWMAATHRRINMKALARYQFILLGEQRHIGVNNLPKVVARQFRGRESNPWPHDHKSDSLTTTPPSQGSGKGGKEEEEGEIFGNRAVGPLMQILCAAMSQVKRIRGTALVSYSYGSCRISDCWPELNQASKKTFCSFFFWYQFPWSN